jgi:hypothetical protein
MKNKIKQTFLFGLIALVVAFAACKKTEYSFGNIKTPSGLAITAVVQGTGTATPNGDGSGKVTITVTATDALTYKIYFGTGDSALTYTGIATYTYNTLGTNTYTITVNAIGTGGAISTLSKQITVLYSYQIPANITSNLTNGTSRTWVIAKDSAGHFGVGPVTSFYPDWYTAAPNEKPACAYGSVITFTNNGSNIITMNDNNAGSSFLIGASTAFYGQAGGDGCYPISTGGTKTLGFSAANSGSNSSNSTGVQFKVPGNGIVGFGTGGTSYEILFLSTKVMVLRNIGIDGNAWYQILKAN